MANYTKPRSDEYYKSLAEVIAWYRSRSFFDLEAAARRLFQADITLALRLYQEGIFTVDSVPAMIRDLQAMILRPKYRDLLADQLVRFHVTNFGQPVFDSFDYTYFMQKYALALQNLTPDTEHLILPYTEYSDVKPIGRSTTV